MLQTRVFRLDVVFEQLLISVTYLWRFCTDAFNVSLIPLDPALTDKDSL